MHIYGVVVVCKEVVMLVQSHPTETGVKGTEEPLPEQAFRKVGFTRLSNPAFQVEE